jgi:hypothetical protein
MFKGKFIKVVKDDKALFENSNVMPISQYTRDTTRRFQFRVDSDSKTTKQKAEKERIPVTPIEVN